MIRVFADYAKEAGVRGPESVTPALLSAYLVYRKETPNGLRRKDRPRTVNTHLLAVRRFLDFLSKEGVVSPALPASLEYVKAPETLPRDIPTDAEVRRMLVTCDTMRTTGFRDRAILELLYSTAMRRQELMDLKVPDVDLSQGYVRIERGKGGKGRVVPLGRVAGDWVRRYLLAIRPELVRGKPDPGWLFVTKAGGKLDGEAVRQTVLKAARAAGIEKKVSPHALRRACATEMIRRSANPWHVKELLGHEDFRSLDVYAKLTILDLKAAHRKYHPREEVGEGNEAGERS
jgi:integrase/recombinase XerD